MFYIKNYRPDLWEKAPDAKSWPVCAPLLPVPMTSQADSLEKGKIPRPWLAFSPSCYIDSGRGDWPHSGPPVSAAVGARTLVHAPEHRSSGCVSVPSTRGGD